MLIDPKSRPQIKCINKAGSDLAEIAGHMGVKKLVLRSERGFAPDSGFAGNVVTIIRNQNTGVMEVFSGVL